MRNRAGFLALALGVLFCGRAAAAQDRDPAVDYLGRVVSSVRVELESRPVIAADLLALIDVQPNQPLRREAIRSSIGRLAALGQYQDVQVVATPADAGVAIVFRLIPRHPIDLLEVTGDTGLPADELRRLVRVRYGGLPTTERLETVEQEVRRILADAGYLSARASARTIETHDPDRATLVIDVDAGAVARIADVAVTGVSPLTREAILSRTGIVVGGPYRPRDLQAKVAAVGDTLRADGYYEAVTTVTGARRDDGVAVTLFVSAGPKVDLHFAGDELPPGDKGDLVPIERYRSADEDLLEDARQRIRAGLARIGYRDARVTVARVPAEDGSRLAITFTVDRGRRYVIDRVELRPGPGLPVHALEEALHLRPGDPFSEAELAAATARVVQEYQRLGYYQVSATPEFQLLDSGERAGETRVVVAPNVTEGPRGTIRAITFAFDGGASKLREADLHEAMASRPGAPYVALTVAQDLRQVETFYRDQGYRSAAATITPSFANDGQEVTLAVRVNEGLLVIVGDIAVVGNQHVSAQSVLDVITLRPGQPFGMATEAESRRRLVELGIFRQVRIIAPPLLPGETRANLVISVEESPASTFGFGGGLEVGRRATSTGEDQFEFAPRGFIEVGRRNLGGRNRSVNLFARVALKPRTTDETTGDSTDYGFSEYRVTGTLREQHAFHMEADLLASLTAEQAIRTSFNFIRRAANAELLRRLSPNVHLFGRYALDYTELFDEVIPPDEQPLIDRLFPQVRLSILSTGILWDRRDNTLATTRGTLTSADLEVAARNIGSEVGYIKLFLQGSAFKRLGNVPRTVLATRAQLGLARGFRGWSRWSTRTASRSSGQAAISCRRRSRTCPRASASSPEADRACAGFRSIVSACPRC